MAYEFNEVPNRRNTDCVKWDIYPSDRLPLWVADMDFAVCPKITNAIQKRLEHPVFGYSLTSPEFKQVFCERMNRLYHWKVEPDDIILVPGIVSGFNFAIRALCNSDNSVIYQTPAYPPFIEAPGNFNLEGISNDLYYQKDENIWRIDFDKFEKQIKDNTSLFILCNPQNPTGRAFTVEELTRLGEICLKHGVKICSDEIHCEILYKGVKHTPIASINQELSENVITFMAPSKTFNIPGLACSVAIIQNPDLRKRFNQALQGIGSFVSVLSVEAGLAAYRDCEDWRKELLEYLEENRDFALNFIHENMPAIKTNSIEATFLMWLDCSKLAIQESPADFFAKNAHVQLNDGAAFGKGYEKFVRLNFGTSRAILTEALENMRKALN
ncbi:MAG: PatB family C-S lyase [Anaerolineaceae bacterium]|nr:PatB family C-S lyase [Anaerolineaceae bacterium]